MKTITNIRQISGNKYSLIIEGKKHIVYDDVLLEYNIFKKGEISDDVYKQIINTNNYHEAYNKMLKYITVKLRTEKEVRDKLVKLYIGKADQDKIIERLKEEHYLDEEMYVKCYVNDNVILSLKGPKKIFFGLTKLGFKESLVSKYLDQIEDNVWFEKTEKILSKKIKGNHKLSKKMFLMKIRKDYINLGYEEKFFNHLLENLDFDDDLQMEKDFQKIYTKLSKKYNDNKLKMMVKQKMYQLGYDLDKIEKMID